MVEAFVFHCRYSFFSQYSEAQIFISGDIGPLHIAAAVGTSTVSLFGPTNPEKYAPLGKLHVALAGKTMQDIKPSEVFQAACNILECKN